MQPLDTNTPKLDTTADTIMAAVNRLMTYNGMAGTGDRYLPVDWVAMPTPQALTGLLCGKAAFWKKSKGADKVVWHGKPYRMDDGRWGVGVSFIKYQHVCGDGAAGE